MREILFRGKRINSGKWVYGGYYVVPDGAGGAIHRIAVSNCERFEYNDVVVDGSTIGQYTGLTDKNGKKIFEGDILGYSSCGKQYRDVVVYGRWNCSCCDGVYGYALLHYGERVDFREVERYEICGNIHDNPELLEEMEK